MDALRLVERFYLSEWADVTLYEELARGEKDERTRKGWRSLRGGTPSSGEGSGEEGKKISKAKGR